MAPVHHRPREKSLESSYMLENQMQNKLQSMAQMASVNWDAHGPRNSGFGLGPRDSLNPSPSSFPNSRKISALSGIKLPEYQYRTPAFPLSSSEQEVKNFIKNSKLFLVVPKFKNFLYL